MTEPALVLAPAGWGYPPGYPLGEIAASTLPDLPLLNRVPLSERQRVVRDALAPLPFVRYIRAHHLMERYDMPNLSARRVIDSLNGKERDRLGRAGGLAKQGGMRHA